MNAIINAAVHHSRSVLSILVLVLIAGLGSFLTIPKESKPDINIPIVYVAMTHDGISPEDAERLLVRPMEQELRSIEGIKEMRSRAQTGSASVLLEFDAGFDVDKALRDVREAIDLVKPDLPGDTEEPTAHEVNVGLFPVLVVTLAGDVPERTLLRLAKDLQDELEAMPGVLEADIIGERKEILEILIDPVRLESYGINQDELFRTVARNNQLIAAGSMDTGKGRFAIKVPGLFESAKDLMELPIKAYGDGVVKVEDVTTVRRTFRDAHTFARIDGQRGITLEIKKRLGENVIETIDQVRALVTARAKSWPAGVQVNFIQDESRNIRRMLDDLQNNVLSAILLVMIVVVAALGLRTAGLVGLAIPASFLFGILVLDAMGLTVNIVVLFALILAVGMLVDGAIVVTEFADRKLAEGLPRQEAYIMAAQRMSWPIIASTATTLAAFMPLVFWPGVVGEFMKFLPITLVVTLAGSLMMALIFVPTLGGLIGKAGSANPKILAALAAAEDGDVRQLPGLTGTYARTLSFLIRRPILVLAAAIVVLVAVQGAFISAGKGVEFFPNVEPEQSLIHVHARGNMSTREKDVLVREVEDQLMDVKGIRTIYARTGGSARGEDQAQDVIGTIFVEFADWDKRRTSAQIMAEVRQRTAHLAGVWVEPREPDVGPPTGKDIQIEFRSRFPERLDPLVALFRGKLESIDGLLDVEDSRALPGIEWQIKVDRPQAGRFNADILTVGKAVQLVTNGIKVGEYRPDDAEEEVEIRIRFPIQDRTIEQLDQLRVETNRGQVPISNFVTRTPQQRSGLLKRSDGQRVIKVQASVAEGLLPDDKVNEIRAWMATQSFDPEVDIRFKGADRDQKEAAEFLKKAFGIALFVMAIILITQFNSFYHALLILTAVIMSTVGVMAGLLITGQAFGIVMTGIGVIALAGIVVNNNIVLIDTYARLVKSGMDPMEAVVRTGTQRLRPVLLTTVTTIFGLLPMVFQTNIDFVARDIAVGAPSTQWWVQLSTAVAFGLSFATILTLFVTPSLLALGANTTAYLTRRRAARMEKRTAKTAAAQPAE
ncbi:MAG: efflux RND transporter permease subunit [Rhodospirillaceae bacterium]|jgi:multidrug efflux pump|nr:efflux RND transporter permease subunit [Rhodospirillaceae bacterium]MBT5195094.1 efflux RND transporter permease subunit [Rhodospirillaceae bacterium]MBT5895144.1 efflux RND transporter permease subunit [Rhodospirillaceae bacterium]MBT6431168.1 efflux RND transporter permease subunit [Rhodospirillaceae bacterium]MBT7757586.1 efflux RND transporter permease subunit [Rhodospirillaceae bacterium]